MKENQQKAALDAIQAIVIQARFVAYNNGSHQEIAALLDQAEYLLGRLSVGSSDWPCIFESVLEDLSVRFPSTCFIFLSFPTGAKSDSEGFVNLQEMLFRSTFVADGEIMTVVALTSETKASPSALPIVRTKYRASFRIDKVVKGVLPDDKTEATTLKLVYSRTNIRNHKSKSEEIPELKEGDRFRLFSNNKLATDEEGELTVFVGTPNQIRPEGYSEIPKTKATSDASSADISLIQKSGSSPHFMGPDSKLTLNPTSSTAWIGLLAILAIAATLLWLLFKPRAK